MKHVSFEEATLEWVNFSNDCDLSTIIIPKTGDYWLYDNWKSRLERLGSRIPYLPEAIRLDVDVFTDTHLGHAKNQNWFLVSKGELSKRYSVEAAEQIIAILGKP